MPHLIEVAFKGNRKEFYLWDADELPPIKAAVIVDADRGEDLGRVHATGAFAEQRYAKVPHGVVLVAAEKRALRLATLDDVRRATENDVSNEQARRGASERVRAHGLVMKMSDAEWQWDRKKLTFYFTADKRVDFRQLVRDLAAMFRARIELKQIGVRDEAKRLDGIGRCGRQYCSAAWLPELRPVNLGVAKDQRLSLNPSQISGACGRLMCSLRYEHEFYVQSRKRFPKEGKILATSRGEEKVVANDIFGERVTLRTAEGEFRVIGLGDLREETAAATAQPTADAPTADETSDGNDFATSVEAVLEAAAAGDGEVPVTLPDARPSPSPRPLREPERRSDPSAAHDEGAASTDPVATASVTNAAAPKAEVEFHVDVASASDATDSADPLDSGDALDADEAPEVGEAGDTARGEVGEGGEGDARRPRRRRGRRGGRRGRGAGAPPTAGGAPAAAPDGEAS